MSEHFIKIGDTEVKASEIQTVQVSNRFGIFIIFSFFGLIVIYAIVGEDFRGALLENADPLDIPWWKWLILAYGGLLVWNIIGSWFGSPAEFHRVTATVSNGRQIKVGQLTKSDAQNLHSRIMAARQT